MQGRAEEGIETGYKERDRKEYTRVNSQILYLQVYWGRL